MNLSVDLDVFAGAAFSLPQFDGVFTTPIALLDDHLLAVTPIPSHGHIRSAARRNAKKFR
jgi:hypothetical protein